MLLFELKLAGEPGNKQHQPPTAGLKERKVTDGCDQLIDKLLRQARGHPIWYSVQGPKTG